MSLLQWSVSAKRGLRNRCANRESEHRLVPLCLPPAIQPPDQQQLGGRVKPGRSPVNSSDELLERRTSSSLVC